MPTIAENLRAAGRNPQEVKYLNIYDAYETLKNWGDALNPITKALSEMRGHSETPYQLSQIVNKKGAVIGFILIDAEETPVAAELAEERGL